MAVIFTKRSGGYRPSTKLLLQVYEPITAQYRCVQPVKRAGKPLSAARNSHIAFWLAESWRKKTANSSITSACFAVTDSNKFVTDVFYWIERRFCRCKALSQCSLKQAFAPFRFQNARVFVVKFNRRIEIEFFYVIRLLSFQRIHIGWNRALCWSYGQESP